MNDPPPTPERSRNMSRIRGSDTKPEMCVRRLVWKMGYRYRLHRRDLPGTPDLVFPSRQKVIFVHGCYWHRHRCVYGRPIPKTRTEFWQAKFDANVKRDRRVVRQLRRAGWDVLIVWECWVKKWTPDRIESRISQFLQER